MDKETLNKMKIVLREESCPFFFDDELEFYYQECGGNFNDAVYRCLILKSEDTTISVSGLSVPDTSKYFKRIASRYRRSNSGTLKEW